MEHFDYCNIIVIYENHSTEFLQLFLQAIL